MADRRRLLTGASLVASFIAATAGCTVIGGFGGFSDQESAGSMGGSGDGTGGMPGDGDGDMGGMPGDGDGDGDGDGTGGAGPTYGCSPTGTAQTVFDDNDLAAGESWVDDYLLVKVGSGVSAVIRTKYDNTDTFTLLIRAIQDSRDNPVGDVSDSYVVNSSITVFGAGMRGSDLVVVAREDSALVELAFPVSGGDSFGDPVRSEVVLPAQCMAPNNIRETVPMIEETETLHGLMCSSSDGMTVASFFGTGGNWTMLNDFTAEPHVSIQRAYRVGNQFFLQTGGDFDDASYRYGSTAAELAAEFFNVSFDDTRITSFGTAVSLDGSELFVWGGALSGPPPEDPMTPALVPARFYAGTYSATELSKLGESAPPDGLVAGPEITGLGDVFVYDQPVSRGGNYYMGGSSYLKSPPRIAVSLVDSSGNFLVKDSVMLEEDGSAVQMAPLGIGMVLTYESAGEIRMLPLICGPE